MKDKPAEPLASLLGLAPGLPGVWHASSSNIAMNPVRVSAAGAEWLVHLHAYAMRKHLTDPRRVEIAVGLTVSTDRLPAGRAQRTRAAEWQRGLAKRLAALGYKGGWGRSPHGPFAYFRKDLRGVSAVPAAIRQLQKVRF